MAERVGFEPTCPLRDKTLSRRPRYDHFGTSPQRNQWRRTTYFTRSVLTTHHQLHRYMVFVGPLSRGDIAGVRL